MGNMFYGCSSLKELNISNFYINDETNMSNMLEGCTEELKKKIKLAHKFIKF